jgi:hypothetical protein
MANSFSGIHKSKHICCVHKFFGTEKEQFCGNAAKFINW